MLALPFTGFVSFKDSTSLIFNILIVILNNDENNTYFRELLEE